MANFTTLASFTPTGGSYTSGSAPLGGLVADAAGNLYGTTSADGAGYGTVFEIAKTDTGYSTTPTVVVSFNYFNGRSPEAGLAMDGSGNLFGTTYSGGAHNEGTIFEITKTISGYSSTPVVLFSFDGTHGAFSAASLTIDASGNLFGTTGNGGANDFGTVFELSKSGSNYSSTPTVLASFTNTTGNALGRFPQASVTLDAAGNLFGTTRFGGASGDGTVFEIAKTSGGYVSGLTTLVNFDISNGYDPASGVVIDAAGNLFGTTSSGGTGFGAAGIVYEVAKTDAGYDPTPIPLTTFTTAGAEGPTGGLILDHAGNIFGTTSGGSTSTPGTAFEMVKTGSSYSAPVTLASFDNTHGVQLQRPAGSLIADQQGNLYGITGLGGTSFKGSVFQLSGTGFDVACYARGTAITTPYGAKPVETLAAGDGVVTASGAVRPIVWIGAREIDCTSHPDPFLVYPVRIQAGALADGIPGRDLFVSPDHAMLVDHVLIQAHRLCNGGSIRPQPVRAVHYFHIELATHDVLLAEGAAAESYLNTGTHDWLVGDPHGTPPPPRLVPPGYSATAPIANMVQAEAIWMKLATRSRSLGFAPVREASVTTDPGLRLQMDAHALKPAIVERGRHIFLLPQPAGSVRLTSRTGRPSDRRPWLDDRRRLGVQVRRILCDDGSVQAEIPVDHSELVHGWWDVEIAGTILARWTNGAGTLSLPANTRTVEVLLQGEMYYPVDGTPSGALGRAA